MIVRESNDEPLTPNVVSNNREGLTDNTESPSLVELVHRDKARLDEGSSGEDDGLSSQGR
jgi:hypothetical protein